MNLSTDNFRFKGFQGTTLLDFPGRIAAILFTGGCNLRCPYCHNHMLIEDFQDLPDFCYSDLRSELGERSGFIDGLVITGGEPTLQPWLGDFIQTLHRDFPDLEIKLDTNGTRPEILKQLLALPGLTMVAMDLKTRPEDYPLSFGIQEQTILSSIELLRQWKGEREFRITCHTPFVSPEALKKIALLLGKGEKIFLQRCVGLETLTLKQAEEMARMMQEQGCSAELRGF